MNFQICNMPNPNSKNITGILYMFMVYNSVTHLHIALDRYILSMAKQHEQHIKCLHGSSIGSSRMLLQLLHTIRAYCSSTVSGTDHFKPSTDCSYVFCDALDSLQCCFF